MPPTAGEGQAAAPCGDYVADGRKRLGAAGEQVAAAHLENNGCKILKRNYTCKRGEIDIIALDGSTICFVEVKTRRPDAPFSPARNVTPAKRRKIRAVAKYYLRSNDLMDHVCGFDIACVIFPRQGEPEVELLKHAF